VYFKNDEHKELFLALKEKVDNKAMIVNIQLRLRDSCDREANTCLYFEER